MERTFLEVIAHSGPLATLLLLASCVAAGAFVWRKLRPATNFPQQALTDGTLFVSVVAFMTFLLLHTLGQALRGSSIKGIDADRALTAPLEGLFVYGCIGSGLVAMMAIAQCVRRK